MDKPDSLENLRIFRSIHDMIKFSIELINMMEFVTNHPNYYTPLEQEYYKEIIDENIVKVKTLIEKKKVARKWKQTFKTYNHYMYIIYNE